ncbi:MAG: TonB-dependent receptor plug domain-containing protein [Cryomorphaceae bacterium]|nr:TonB-dependent receptor plug domain-containing protein [Cryomorphaceae bacterium]
MKSFKALAITCLTAVLASCSSTKTTTASATRISENQNLGNVSLLDRLRQQSGLIIRGSDSSAQIFMRGVSSLNNPKQVMFIVDGTQVGDFSQASSTINPLEIGSIRVLKNPQDLAQYGFMGAGGVIIIKTKK